MKRFLQYILITIIPILISACATTSNLNHDKQVRIALIKYEMARNIILHKDYKNLATAFKYLNEAKKTLKDDPRVYYLLAIAYQLRGNLNKYEELLKKTIQINKNFFDAYNALGVYYSSIGQYDKALNMFNQLIQNPLYPNADIAFYNRALVYINLGKIKNALDDLRNAIVFSNYSNPLYFKALINFEISNRMYLLALKDLDSMEDHIGESCYTKINKALCYIRLHELKQAKEKLNSIKEKEGKCYKQKVKLMKELNNDSNTNN